MHPAAVARTHPNRPAQIMAGTGATTSFAELAADVHRVANLFRARGLDPGGSVAIVAENHARYLVAAWAAHTSGLRYTAVNRHLTAEETAYIVDDCGARMVLTSEAMADVVDAACAPAAAPAVEHRVSLDGGFGAFESCAAIDRQPTDPIANPCVGGFMLYSSGTTGRPKGIARPLPLTDIDETPLGTAGLLQLIGFRDGAVYLNPAPLYHAAPLAWTMGAQSMGGTAVVMESFDAELCLDVIGRHRVTHAQFVPTMFVRMLKLDEERRAGADLSSLESVVHAAAPCPVEVKRAMIDWWGPIVHEYYSSTEGVGFTFITAEDWLRHPGSVGRALVGEPHILDEHGNELPPGEVGQVWFSGGTPFEYHNAPAKTAEARRDDGLASVGDVGYLDDDGYLHLTDRKAFTIISGGVNIYPQEIEDVLVTHPRVLDAAVFGVPEPEMGESVFAVVQPLTGAGDEALTAELVAHCREHLAGYKVPRHFAYERELPRSDTGKLYKRLLRERYAERAASEHADPGP